VSLLVQAVALCLIYARDREDYRAQTNGHRGQIVGALLKLWSIREDHHGDAQHALNSEYKHRRRVLDLGYYDYAVRYVLWASVFAAAVVLVRTAFSRG
jgi:hypothetical protein